jgi:hypothetical protein
MGFHILREKVKRKLKLIGNYRKDHLPRHVTGQVFKDYHMCNSLEEAIDRAYENGGSRRRRPFCRRHVPAGICFKKLLRKRGDIFKEYVRKAE